MDIRLVKQDCDEITSSQLEDGIFEIIVPKKCKDSEINGYLNGLGAEISNIESKQKKAREKFRKKVDGLIDDYKKEFQLNFMINLRIDPKLRQMFNSSVEIHGIEFSGKISISSILQYMPEDVVDNVVRCAVYTAAVEYENRWSKLNAAESDKYQITMQYSEIKKIQTDYSTAEQDIMKEMRTNPIISI